MLVALSRPLAGIVAGLRHWADASSTRSTDIWLTYVALMTATAFVIGASATGAMAVTDDQLGLKLTSSALGPVAEGSAVDTSSTNNGDGRSSANARLAWRWSATTTWPDSEPSVFHRVLNQLDRKSGARPATSQPAGWSTSTTSTTAATDRPAPPVASTSTSSSTSITFPQSAPPPAPPTTEAGPSSTHPTPVKAPTTAAPMLPPPSVAPTTTRPRPPAPVRKRRPITATEFRRFVASRGFTTADYLTPGLVHGTYVDNGQKVNVLLVHRSRSPGISVSPGTDDPAPVGSWAQRIGAVAGINANWYAPFDGPAVAGGSAYGGSDHGYTALFGFTESGDLVAQHHSVVIDQVDPRVVEGVAGHPTLIHRGVVTTEFGGDPTFTRRHPRTAIGATESVDIVLLVTVDGRRADAAGMSGLETAQLLNHLGAHDAVMLDGGGSSAMWIRGRGIVNSPSDPGRRVGNQIAVFG